MPTTKERILDAALNLFATKGYGGTRIRELEQEAGLAAGKGSLYRHFVSKKEVLEALIQRENERARQFRELKERAIAGTLGNTRAELILMYRLALMNLESLRPLIMLLSREYGHFPDLFADLRSVMVDESRSLLASDLKERMQRGELPTRDPQALAAVVYSALTGYHLTRVFFAQTPAGVEEDRFTAFLADLVLTPSGENHKK
jgi:AcrR family transcriptional regulator